MIPKDILKYSLDDWLFNRYPGAYYAASMAKLKQPVYFYSYGEDSCYRVQNGVFFKKFRGENPENITPTAENIPIAEYRISAEKFDSEITEKKTVVISKEAYGKFGTAYTPWSEPLYRLLFEECTADPRNINYVALTNLFYEDKNTPPVVVINDARAILGLSEIPSKSSQR